MVITLRYFAQISANLKKIITDMNENELSFLVRGAAFKVHNSLGPGLFESVYEKALTHELISVGLEVKNQLGIPMIYQDIHFDCGFRLDILVNDLVIVEVKSVEILMEIHHKQLLTYLKLMKKRLGLLINFNSISLDKKALIRVVNNL
jgi:GxxExxY protein